MPNSPRDTNWTGRSITKEEVDRFMWRISPRVGQVPLEGSTIVIDGLVVWSLSEPKEAPKAKAKPKRKRKPKPTLPKTRLERI